MLVPWARKYPNKPRLVLTWVNIMKMILNYPRILVAVLFPRAFPQNIRPYIRLFPAPK